VSSRRGPFACSSTFSCRTRDSPCCARGHLSLLGRTNPPFLNIPSLPSKVMRAFYPQSLDKRIPFVPVAHSRPIGVISCSASKSSDRGPPPSYQGGPFHIPPSPYDEKEIPSPKSLSLSPVTFFLVSLPRSKGGPYPGKSAGFPKLPKAPRKMGNSRLPLNPFRPGNPL